MNYLEHANITTNNIEESIDFLKIVFPDFYIRHQAGKGSDKWIHFGNEKTYIALNQGEFKDRIPHNYGSNGIKHLGFVVDNLEKLGKKLINAGYERSYPIMKHPFRRREYFFDKSGLEYEFIEYFTDVESERNEYSIQN